MRDRRRLGRGRRSRWCGQVSVGYPSARATSPIRSYTWPSSGSRDNSSATASGARWSRARSTSSGPVLGKSARSSQRASSARATTASGVMPTGTPPISVSAGEESTSGSPSAVGSGSFHSSACVGRPARIMPSTSWARASSSRAECLVLRADVPAKVSSFSLTCSSSSGRWRDSVLLQRAGLVDGGTAALLALHLVLRVVGARPDLPAGGLGVLRDLLLHRALGLAAMALPAHVVALAELVGHRGPLLGLVLPPCLPEVAERHTSAAPTRAGGSARPGPVTRTGCVPRTSCTWRPMLT